MEDFDAKEFLIFALKHFRLKVIRQDMGTIDIEKGYRIEIEGEKLFKLMHCGQVISPFADVEEMCVFIKKDIELNEKS